MILARSEHTQGGERRYEVSNTRGLYLLKIANRFRLTQSHFPIECSQEKRETYLVASHNQAMACISQENSYQSIKY